MEELLPSRRQTTQQAEDGLCFHFGLNLFALEWGHSKSYSASGHPLSQRSPYSSTTDKLACGWHNGGKPASFSWEPIHPIGHASQPCSGISSWAASPRSGWPGPCHRDACHVGWQGGHMMVWGSAGRGGPRFTSRYISAPICCYQVTQPAIVKTVNFSWECFN